MAHCEAESSRRGSPTEDDCWNHSAEVCTRAHVSANSVLPAFVTRVVKLTHIKSPGFFLFPAMTAAVHT